MGVSSQIIESWECEACKCSATINATQKNGHSGVDGWHHVALEIPHCHIDKLLLCPKCVTILKNKFNEISKVPTLYAFPLIIRAYNNLVFEIAKEKEREEKEEKKRKIAIGVEGAMGVQCCTHPFPPVCNQDHLNLPKRI